jgi:hypothetical protein
MTKLQALSKQANNAHAHRSLKNYRLLQRLPAVGDGQLYVSHQYPILGAQWFAKWQTIVI